VQGGCVCCSELVIAAGWVCEPVVAVWGGGGGGGVEPPKPPVSTALISQ